MLSVRAVYVLSSPQVLSGVCRIGKTQTAIEYAHRHLAEYANVFWTTANSQKSLVSGYATIVRLLKLSDADTQDQTMAVEAVKRWLTSQRGWLLILDNVDDLGIVRAFIPLGKTVMCYLQHRQDPWERLPRLSKFKKWRSRKALS
jgi:hypothetical protein